MIKLKVGIISLGCDKNRVDSEIIIDKLYSKYEIVTDAKKADIIIINTCGFIEESKQESIDTILEMSQYKSQHNCKVLVVTGCLTQRYKDELLELIPEIDVMLGVNDYDKLLSSIDNFLKYNKKISHCNYNDYNINVGSRFLTTPKGTAYIRIAEGCSNYCTYCIIPKIRGKYRSRNIKEIIKEAIVLSNQGVKEIILIAQDITKYGIDLYGEKKLSYLINEISKISGIEWIRLLYCYPEEIDDNLINVIAENDKVCKYIDIPLQHISDKMLKMMNRKNTKEEIINCILKLKSKVPNICIRTSLIVGFPGEEQDDFDELKSFVQEIKFDKLGVFKYSQEEDTPAALMPGQVNEETKITRQQELMLIQKEISTNNNMAKKGKTYKVLIEGFNGEMWYGRNYEMSPQVDGVIFFKCDKILNVGEFKTIKIIESLEYDLIGVV